MSLQQTLEIVLTEVQAVTIHGSPYYELQYRTPGGPETHHMRINPEAFYADPQPGDRVAVNILMGNILGATKLH